MLIGYFILLLLIVLFGIPLLIKDSQYTRLFFLTTAFIELWLIASLRNPNFIADDFSYLYIFAEPTKCYMEQGFCILNTWISQWGDSPQLFFGVIDGIILLFIFQFIYKYSPNLVLSVIVFISLMYFFNSLNIIRQFLAFGIILYSFKYIINKKFLLFLCFIILACFFHKSAIICLIFYWLYHLNFNAKNIAIIIFCALLFFLCFDIIAQTYISIFGDYAQYLLVDEQNSRASNITRFLLNLIIFIVGTLFALRHTTKTNFPLRLDFLLICSAISTAGALLSLHAYHAERIVYYFYLMNIILIPQLACMINNKNTKFLFISVTCFCCITYGTIVLYYWQQKGLIYTFFWQ